MYRRHADHGNHGARPGRLVVAAVLSVPLSGAPFAEDLQFWLVAGVTVASAVVLARLGRQALASPTSP